MPFITVRMLAGRTGTQKTALSRDLTEVVERHLGVQPERINVVIHEIEGINWAVAGKPLAAESATTASLKEGGESL